MHTPLQLQTYLARPFSWSQKSSWDYDKPQWYRSYILGIRDPASASMLFGNIVGERLASDPTYLPEVSRYPVFEQKLTGKINGIQLLGFLDSFCPDTKNFYEYKTSSNPKKWTQKSTQEHGQILFYKALLWLAYGVPPEEIQSELFYIPVNETGDFGMEVTKDATIESFKVSHTTLEVLQFMRSIEQTRKEMIAYALSTPPLAP